MTFWYKVPYDTNINILYDYEPNFYHVLKCLLTLVHNLPKLFWIMHDTYED